MYRIKTDGQDTARVIRHPAHLCLHLPEARLETQVATETQEALIWRDWLYMVILRLPFTQECSLEVVKADCIVQSNLQ